MDLFEELAQTGKISSSLLSKFDSQYGEIFFKALEYLQIEGKKVYKHIFSPSKLVVWSVEGKEDMYLVYPGQFCQCTAFQMDAIYKKRVFTISKSDLLDDELKHAMEEDLPDLPGIFTSSVTGSGLTQLKDVLWRVLETSDDH